MSFAKERDTHLLDFLVKLHRPKFADQYHHVNEIRQDEDGRPHEHVGTTLGEVGPHGEEDTAKHEHAAHVESGTVAVTGGQKRQQEESTANVIVQRLERVGRVALTGDECAQLLGHKRPYKVRRARLVVMQRAVGGVEVRGDLLRVLGHGLVQQSVVTASGLHQTQRHQEHDSTTFHAFNDTAVAQRALLMITN